MIERKERKIWAAYFSGTGTTEKVVKLIARTIWETMREKASAGESGETVAEAFGGEGAVSGAVGGGTEIFVSDLEPEIFDFSLPAVRQEEKVFQEEDLVVFGVPVYAGRVPNLLLKYLNSIQGGGALAIPVVLFGNRNFDDGLIELRNILEADGFRTVAAGAFVGEHSFSKVLGAGRPDEKDLEIARAFAKKAAEKVMGGGFFGEPVSVRGEEPIRNYYQPRDRQGNPIDIRKVKPKTSEACIHCKLCAKLCPMGSIDFEDVSQVPGVCIKCCACVKKCPAGAKYYDDEGYLYHQHELEEMYARRAEPEVFL